VIGSDVSNLTFLLEVTHHIALLVLWLSYLLELKRYICLCQGSGGGAAAAVDAGSYKDFTTQYAKSGASTCRGCENKIAKVYDEQLFIITFVIVVYFDIFRWSLIDDNDCRP